MPGCPGRKNRKTGWAPPSGAKEQIAPKGRQVGVPTYFFRSFDRVIGHLKVRPDTLLPIATIWEFRFKKRALSFKTTRIWVRISSTFGRSKERVELMRTRI